MSNWPLHSFHGGIHPSENKHQSTQAAISTAPIPKRLLVPVLQHAGQAAEPCVELGQYVYKGQLIATKNGAISTAVHAPSSGTVVSVEQQPYPHPSGEPFMAIEIATDGLDQWQIQPQPQDYQQLGNADIFQAIQNAGISGMGGAGFPTDIKLSGLIMDGIEFLIINGTECEPYITADDMLMRERSELIATGIEILCRLTKPKQVLIAIEDNKPQAIAAMRASLRNPAHLVVELPTIYPSGGERQLIQILTGKEVPSGGLPIELGILCQNVGTCAAIAEAVTNGKPLISRITTLTGDALSRPMNVECLIGTPVIELLEHAGLKKEQLHKVIAGGPMMGFELHDLSAPVIKTSNCFIAGTQSELPVPEPALPCIRCGECEQVCPSNLLPQQLLYFANGQQHEQLKAYNLFDCIECGCCSYVCSSQIPLVQYYRAAKAEIRTLEQKQAKAEHAKQRFEFRQERLRLEEEQKAAERKARNERLAKAKAAQELAEQQAPAQPGASSEEDIKKLKIAASMAKVALRKAEKQLQQHGTSELEQQVAQLKAAAEQAASALEQAQAGSNNSAPTPAAPAATPTIADEQQAALKKAKVKLAMSKAALKKAQKAEADAEQISQLEQELAQAEQQLARLTAAE